MCRARGAISQHTKPPSQMKKKSPFLSPSLPPLPPPPPPKKKKEKKRKKSSSRRKEGRKGSGLNEQQQSALLIFCAITQRLHFLQRGLATIRPHRNRLWLSPKEEMGPTLAPFHPTLRDPAVTESRFRLRWLRKKYKPRRRDYSIVEFFVIGGIDSMAVWLWLRSWSWWW